MKFDEMKCTQMKLRLLVSTALVLGTGASTVLSAQTVNTLFSFNLNTDGAQPVGRLTRGLDGNFYGTTSNGGNNFSGEVFKITPAGTFSILYTFSGPDGAQPNQHLTLGDDGSLYGTTPVGGSSGYGTIFKITTEGVLTTLHDFDGTDGSYPGALMLMNGSFYGTTSIISGGPVAATLFTITPGGQFTTVRQYGSDLFPYYLTQRKGVIYGLGYSGSGDGSIIAMNTSGQIKVLFTFTGPNGINPQGLTLGSDGNFYGETQTGGANGLGTIFKVTPEGSLTTLYTFTLLYGRDGSQPTGGLELGSDGALYGTTLASSTLNGNIFRITTAGEITILYNFPNFNEGGGYTLVQDTNGTFFGTGYGQGVYSFGSVFTLRYGLPAFVTMSPAYGTVGEQVIIQGQGFTGTSAVSFNGVPATFQVLNEKLIQAQVPAGASTGTVVVTTTAGPLATTLPFAIMN